MGNSEMEQLDVHPSSPKASLSTDDDILESLNMRYGTEVVSRVRRLLQTEREHTETRSPRTQEACRGPTSSVQPGAIVRNHERSSISPSVHMDGTAGSERLAVSQTPPMRPASPVDKRRGSNSSAFHTSTPEAQSWHCRACHRDPCENTVAAFCGHIFCSSCLIQILRTDMCCSACGQVFLLKLDLRS
ncbi:hypothetical protein K466DRAFT_198949 [Polyporus arcularius HHB13444]|uniref:RING-type domain-containing protein n=1 Tax=Polyporus arcularius HHB13444 TaxID=1314778 RepID=A0A5C3P9E8_9APHY|nr:hypothetical protein K466DRAFT_198949 [Polyporus arcularius HHB13444]